MAGRRFRHITAATVVVALAVGPNAMSAAATAPTAVDGQTTVRIGSAGADPDGQRQSAAEVSDPRSPQFSYRVAAGRGDGIPTGGGVDPGGPMRPGGPADPATPDGPVDPGGPMQPTEPAVPTRPVTVGSPLLAACRRTRPPGASTAGAVVTICTDGPGTSTAGTDIPDFANTWCGARRLWAAPHAGVGCAAQHNTAQRPTQEQ